MDITFVRRVTRSGNRIVELIIWKTGMIRVVIGNGGNRPGGRVAVSSGRSRPGPGTSGGNSNFAVFKYHSSQQGNNRNVWGIWSMTEMQSSDALKKLVYFIIGLAVLGIIIALAMVFLLHQQVPPVPANDVLVGIYKKPTIIPV
jgi:hypothetical protein